MNDNYAEPGPPTSRENPKPLAPMPCDVAPNPDALTPDDEVSVLREHLALAAQNAAAYEAQANAWRARAEQFAAERDQAQRDHAKLMGLKRLHVEGGKFEMTLHLAHEVAALFGAAMAEIARPAKNCVEATLVAGGEEWVLTIQKPGGKTPLTLKIEAEAECNRLREELAETRALHSQQLNETRIGILRVEAIEAERDRLRETLDNAWSSLGCTPAEAESSPATLAERIQANGAALAEAHRCLELERTSKSGAYTERNALVAALSKLFPASLERHQEDDRTWEDDWRWIVFIDLPTGQASWHIHDSQLPMFAHLPRLAGRVWDGHNTQRKYERLAALASLAPPTQSSGDKP